MKLKTRLLIMGSVAAVGGLLWTGAIQQETAAGLLEKAVYLEETKGDLQGAIDLYKQIVDKFGDSRSVAAKALLRLGGCYERLGLSEAQKTFNKVITDYPEQTEAVKAAREKLAMLSRAVAARERGNLDYKMTRIAVDQEAASLAFISPDGKKLAIIGGKEGDIWVQDILTGNSSRITQTPVYKYWCFWSPDSKKIAFLDVLNGLHFISSTGGETITLIKGDSDFIKSGKFAWPVGWTPENDKIVCQVSGTGLCAIPLDRGAWQDVFKFSSPEQEKEFTSLSISPDNKHIAYSCTKSGNNDIYIMPTTGGEPVRVTDHPASDFWPAWSWDGKWLAFLSNRNGEDNIWIVRVSPEGKPQGEPFSVSQIAGGRNSTFSWTNNGNIGISLSSAIKNLVIKDLDSGRETPLTNMLTNDDKPRWSPDGSQVVYASEKSGKMDLWLVGTAGGEPTLITGTFSGQQGVRFISSPCWLPDGQNIAFVVVTDDKRNNGIWVVSAKRVDARKIEFTPEGTIQRIDWSPDGKKIAFDYTGAKDDHTIKGSRIFENDIYIMPAQGGEPTRITRIEKEGLSFDAPRWSPDQRKLAFWATDWLEYNRGQGNACNQIWVADLTSNTVEPIMKSVSSIGKGLSWAPDGKSLFFTGTENKISQIFRVPVEGGEPINMNIEGLYPDCSPDGKRIVYSKWMKGAFEFWLAENFLPAEKK
jgi:Tol biopolymer transport system component